MHTFNPSKIELSFKDNSKGQKIAAGLYLVTSHLSDMDPMKNALRSCAVKLLDSDNIEHKRSLAIQISDLLTTSVLSRLISEKNASILVLELRHYASLAEMEGDAVTEALKISFGQPTLTTLPHNTTQTKRTTLNTPQRQSSQTINSPEPENKEKVPSKTQRQEKILKFINDRKSAGIKDISELFPEVSEKTIQRELAALVSSGHITKRGQKRWSVYMAI